MAVEQAVSVATTTRDKARNLTAYVSCALDGKQVKAPGTTAPGAIHPSAERGLPMPILSDLVYRVPWVGV